MIDGVEEIVAVGSRMGTYVSIRPYTKQKKASRWDLGSIDRSIDLIPLRGWLDSFDTKRKITQVRTTVWSSSDGRENAFESS